jgi:hypothetical protein
MLADPTWQAELTSPTPGTFAPLPPTAIDLQVSWNGTIDAGKVHIEFAPPGIKKSGSYIVRSSASSLGTAALLFPYQSSFWSELNPSTWRPSYFHAVETDKKESTTTTVHYFSNRVESQETSKLTKSNTTKQTDRTFTYSPVFDMFSAMLHVRSQKLDTDDVITMVIYPFGTPYLLRIKVQGREVHNTRNTIHLTMSMRKIDRKSLELRPYKKLKQDAHLWLSDDTDRIPIELRATAFIGDVRATLTSQNKLK